MTVTPSLLHRQTTDKKHIVALYWDYQNVKLSLDIAKFWLEFAHSKGRLIRKNIYYNSQCKDQNAVKKEFAGLNLEYCDVPCPLKNSADNQLIADCLDDLDSHSSPDIVFLISGDGDYVKLVKNLQKQGLVVIIIAQLGNVKQKLKAIADEFYFTDDLPQLMNENTHPQEAAFKYPIDYNEAIKHLIEAVKFALAQCKPAKLGYIDKLMRQRCQQYQGYSSISTPDGKKFQKFSQFVNAAVKDGKVKRQNEELFLAI